MRSVSELGALTGRKALVTGGAGHVGLAVGEVLAELGAQMAVVDLNAEACAARVDLLCRQHPDCAVAMPCDLANEVAMRRAVHDTIKHFDGLDILIHCAAYVGTSALPGWAVPFEQQTVAAWDAALRVNLTAAFILVQEAAQALATSGQGSVIFFSSIYGLTGPDLRLYEGTPMANPTGYGVSKGGLLQLTRYLSTILAPRIRVNAISPGGIWRQQPEAFQQRYVTRTPLGRMATEEDLKGAVAFLASNLSAYVTGHNLVVDGGWTAW